MDKGNLRSSSLSSSSDSESSTSSSRSSLGAEPSLPAGVTVYSEENPPASQLYGYWMQRRRLFSRYDEGIWMTDDAWFEVTPEKIAAKIAEHILQVDSITRVIDAFCGVGGNAIQFALSPKCEKVFAIDSNPSALACARHNAALYGVSEKIDFIQGDFFALIDTTLKDVEANAVFLSPPWGGPQYRADQIFDLERMAPYSGSHIINAARKLTPNLALYIPRTSDLNQLAKMVPDGIIIQAVHYCANQRSKALTVYFGALSA